MEAEVANLQAEPDARYAEAVVEGRVEELPQEIQPIATGSPRRSRAAASPKMVRRRPPTPAAAETPASEPETPAGGRAARLTSTARPAATAEPGYPATCPIVSPPPARRSSASIQSASRRHVPRRHGPAVRRARRLVAGGRWVTDAEGVVSFRDVAPAAGPPPDPPLARLGPAISGALSGLILEDDGKLQMRLGLVAPPDDPARPWRIPLALRLAFRFEPARATAMRPNELAETVLAGFVRAIEGLGRP